MTRHDVAPYFVLGPTETSSPSEDVSTDRHRRLIMMEFMEYNLQLLSRGATRGGGGVIRLAKLT